MSLPETPYNNLDTSPKVKSRGLLTSMLNPENVASVSTLPGTGRVDMEKVFVETVDGLTNSRSTRKKKIIVIKKRREQDGSTSKTRQEFYKDYGIEYANKEGKKLKRTLSNFNGSCTALETVIRNGNELKICPDGGI